MILKMLAPALGFFTFSVYTFPSMMTAESHRILLQRHNGPSVTHTCTRRAYTCAHAAITSDDVACEKKRGDDEETSTVTTSWCNCHYASSLFLRRGRFDKVSLSALHTDESSNTPVVSDTALIGTKRALPRKSDCNRNWVWRSYFPARHASFALLRVVTIHYEKQRQLLLQQVNTLPPINLLSRFTFPTFLIVPSNLLF